MYGILKDTYQNNNAFFWLTKLDLHLIHLMKIHFQQEMHHILQK